MNKTKLLQGDNILSLKKLPDNSIDSIVTDPPYGLSFMGKKWDYDVPSVDFWKEVYRVLKPGGHVLSFGSTRTYHRMTVNIEDAGFEIRDQIMWLYGSGFPKSLNIGKAVDKIRGNEREEYIDEDFLKRNPTNNKDGILELGLKDGLEAAVRTKGTSEWEGWGTALKPANEPICLARKPLSEKTIAANVLKWGTGGINIDGCRVDTNGENISVGFKDDKGNAFIDSEKELIEKRDYKSPEGRFPANIILDEEAGMALDEQSGISGSLSTKKKTTRKRKYEAGGGSMMANREDIEGIDNYGDKGGASRFFYCPKVSKKERNVGCENMESKKVCQGGYDTDWSSDKEGDIGINKVKEYKNFHPTVKPISLMTYLCRLVTPPNGIVLDPFMGSGSTGCAAIKEGFRFCGMEMDEDYFEIATKRINHYAK